MDVEDEKDLTTGSALLLTPISIVAPMFGPVGIMAGIAAGVVGAGISTWLSRRAERRLQAFAEQLVAGLPQSQIETFEEALRTDEVAEDLAARAVSSALQAGSDAHARSLADLLVKGVLGDTQDRSKAELLIATLNGVTSQELDGLATLHASQAQSARKGRASAQGSLDDGTTTGGMVAEAVVARLVGRGLLWVDPPSFPGFEVTPLGRQVLDALDEQSTGSDDTP